MLELAAGSEAERDLWVAGLTAVLDMEEDAVNQSLPLSLSPLSLNVSLSLPL